MGMESLMNQVGLEEAYLKEVKLSQAICCMSTLLPFVVSAVDLFLPQSLVPNEMISLDNTSINVKEYKVDAVIHNHNKNNPIKHQITY